MNISRPAQGNSSYLTIMALFARMDTIAMSAAVSLFSALGLAMATAVLLLLGAPPGMPIGSNLSTLGNILPGYAVTWLGCLIGAAWAGLIGAVLGFVMAVCWNFVHIVFLGVLALFYSGKDATSMDGNLAPAEAERALDQSSADRNLLSSVARLNVTISALGVGTGLGLLLLLATYVSIEVSDDPGRYFNLLSVFMPGYSASPLGAWFGLLWGLIYGAVSGGMVAWLYARTLGETLPALVMWDDAAARNLRPPVLLMSGPALGISLGLVVALQLILTTTWLVLRGTANESVHAQLLHHYLPHYTVTLTGGLLGGLELFLLVYVTSALISTTYNFFVRVRRK